MPEADLALEVKHADHDLALGVVAGDSQRAAVAEHRAARVRHAHHTAVLPQPVLKRVQNPLCAEVKSNNLSVELWRQTSMFTVSAIQNNAQIEAKVKIVLLWQTQQHVFRE